MRAARECKRLLFVTRGCLERSDHGVCVWACFSDCFTRGGKAAPLDAFVMGTIDLINAVHCGAPSFKKVGG
jgi:hypothetical protein